MLPIDLDEELLLLEEMLTNEDTSVYNLTFQSPVMLVFLRHFGCVFCKEALHDISLRRKTIEQSGIKIVFVHMADGSTAVEYFQEFKLAGATFVCDPTQQFYQAFGLQRGSFTQLYGLKTWIRGYKVKQELGYELEMAKRLGDSTQMPGVFVLQNGMVRDKFIHRMASERPDYEQLMQCCVI
ncbi:MAG: redoxin domain-containing protein [Saprospiraceae bacterium]|nr:redoxin domain-containing protein [Saprospiraceae bacterium]MCF8249193.1 redoxin domain-containing protein [Saprospiraceae bacterium]MCF8281837.1 redoxin domain-containing protein [Bacteroidales bacterium]MCF8311322.1 redoxin domain-containing protein [Saprospiraceae bacterium]MCF8440114.1 redoxin domain-containing protein [Saprospiraceae bacterium]